MLNNNRRRPTSVNNPALHPKLPDRCRLSSKLISSKFFARLFPPWPATISRKEGGRSADDIIRDGAFDYGLSVIHDRLLSTLGTTNTTSLYCEQYWRMTPVLWPKRHDRWLQISTYAMSGVRK
ncbi:uncharacterized protein LAJ45_07522 [Morchella importuna]|uniref:uncharacterized protein n=1 Tax=Morchella importuna TaxID=1174673 RepID=UPI001E8D43E9|nr:uncharacterized protein LAJ45_07522 [Morchella importuna]KAH8148420.1 hypothetical protein LAJ45_07522 [Morchella importuna]